MFQLTEIYMQQPEGFEMNKLPYDLKHSGWNCKKMLNEYLSENFITECTVNIEKKN